MNDYEIIGFYLQQILFGKFNKDDKKTLKELKRGNLKLKGYSLGNESKLSEFDSTYEASELIHGMKLTNKGKSLDNKIKSVFKKYELIMSSSLSDKEKENLISYIDRLKNALKGGLENDKTNI